MPYRPVYIASHRTLHGEEAFTWDLDRQTVYQEYLDDAEMVRLGELAAARFILVDVPVPMAQVRAHLDAHPELWRP